MAALGSITTAVEAKDEVPKPPKTYRLVLKMSWKRFKECFVSKDALDSQEKMKKERKAILNKVRKGEEISEAERELLNSSFKEMLLSLFDNLQTCLLNYLELEEHDSPKLQSFKMLAAVEVTAWLKNLDLHISKSLEAIVDPNLPQQEMIAKTKEVIEALKNEIKPENFSDYLSMPVDPEISDETEDDLNLTQESNEEDGVVWDVIFGDWFFI